MGTRKNIRRTVLAGVLAALSFSAVADGYPERTIRMILPYAAGGITDLAARVAAQHMSTKLGQQVIVENRGGAGTRIGVAQVAKAEPDGYTILFANSITHGSMPAMSKSLPFDPVKDFVPVVTLFEYANILVCHPSVPWNTVKEMIDYSKANPGMVNNATAGPGTGHDMLGNRFNMLAGTNITQVHYKGAGPGMQDVLAGNAHCIYAGGEAKAHLASGKLKALGTVGEKPDPNFPGVPVMNATLPGFTMPVWQGIVAPAGTPAEVVAKLNAAANEALKNPELLKRTQELGLSTAGGTPAQLQKRIDTDMAQFAEIVKTANIPKQ
jgi:tripartite-type tricarboxylate transporter receptor subunit TctC